MQDDEGRECAALLRQPGGERKEKKIVQEKIRNDTERHQTTCTTHMKASSDPLWCIVRRQRPVLLCGLFTDLCVYVCVCVCVCVSAMHVSVVRTI